MRQHFLLSILCIMIVWIIAIDVSTDIPETSQELPADLQQFITKISTSDIEHPAELSTWLLGFFLSYENFRTCTKYKTCKTDTDSFQSIEKIRKKIMNYIERNKIAIKNYRKMSEEDLLNPLSYNNQFYQAQYIQKKNQESVSKNKQETYREKTDINNYDQITNKGRFARTYDNNAQTISWQPRPFGYGDNEAKNQQWKDVQFVTGVEHVSYYQPTYDIFVQCKLPEQVCVTPDHCHNEHVFGIHAEELKSGVC